MSRESTETVAPGEDRGLDLFVAGTVVAERYVVESHLGSGGSARVYAARDRLLDRRVALKVLRREHAGQANSIRMRREVAVARQISSNAVVRVFDIGETADGTTFVTMELVEGEPLRDVIAQGPMAVDRTIEIALELLDALGEVHRAGVVHRDVKPANVLVDREGRIKLADLGLARTFDHDELRATQTEAVVGTMEYLAPEQALGKGVDARSDLYSFGVLLFECLSGELPFGTRSSVAAILAHVNERPRDVRALRRDAPRWLALVIRKLLEKNPARRYQSAAAVRAAIEQRRAPLDWRAIAAAAAVAGVALGGAWAYPHLTTSSPRFHALSALGTRGLRAMDASGATLWSRNDVEPVFAVPARQGDDVRWIVVMPGADVHQGPETRGEIQLLDPDTGAILARTRLPSRANTFPKGFADEFGASPLVATDLDRDGTDEIVITYTHVYWPSYTILYRPAENEGRMILAASGHHRFVGSVDVDGDGSEELLIGGINNLMGWYTGLAAISIAEPKGLRTVGRTLVRTPDAAAATGNLKWYALLPQSYTLGREVRAGAHPGELELSDSQGRVVRIGKNGLLPMPDGVPPVDPAERLRKREAAYEELRAADRLSVSGDSAGAIDECARAADLADAAYDPNLAEWARRKRAKFLARAGRIEEAVAAAEALAERSETPSDVRFDVARELHLAGRLDSAIALYSSGLFGRRVSRVGRLPYEFLEGAVLAYCEQRRFDEALRFCERFFNAAHESGSLDGYLVTYVKLRQGNRTPPIPDTTPGETDFSKVIRLEWQLARGDDAAGVLARADAELARGNGVPDMLHSVRAAALRRLGRREEAEAAARLALLEAEKALPGSIITRAHMPVMRERLAATER